MNLNKQVSTARLPTKWGEFLIHAIEGGKETKEHIALSMGDIRSEEPLLVRIHSECLTGDALFSLRCDCGFQLESVMQQIAQGGRGLLIYLRQEGRGIGLFNKIKAYALQDQGLDTVEANQSLGFAADLRDFTPATDFLNLLSINRIRLMTNNPQKVLAVRQAGIEVTERVSSHVGHNQHNKKYLATKKGKLGHL